MLKLYNTWCGYLLLLLVVFSNPLNAKETLHIAVASNFKPVLQTLVTNPALKNINIKIYIYTLQDTLYILLQNKLI